ncbi:MAG: UvrD-helicase domain-containing protein [Deltaproteobacteria bacterium]|nr:UvrD-helicase domain-containing protein [Deltaproteobacteria bacterium]
MDYVSVQKQQHILSSLSCRFNLNSLNQPQREAVMHNDGPLLVLAGAGTGKTRVIIYRIVRLISDGVVPARILGLTFTNKAATEMRQRLALMIGKVASAVRLSTFHSLGLEIIRNHPQTVGLRKGFCIYDTADQLGLVRELLRNIKVADRRLDVKRILDIILRTKKARLDEVGLDWGDDYELAAYDLYPRYIAQMRAYNAIDFDDLILHAQTILSIDKHKQKWQETFDYFLVDEYQDTSPDQLAIVHALCGDKQNVCAVGDDDQSIYSWRGAAAGNILNFAKHFPQAKEVVLDQNYRSTSNVLQVANSVIQNNAKRKPKKLWSTLGEGEPVIINACNSEDDEAEFVGDTIGSLIYDGVKPEDIAILYRANAQSQIFEETLAMARIAFRVVGGQAFFDRKEVRDAIAFLSVINNPYDEVSLRRIINIPPRGIGPASVERFVQYAERHKRHFFWAIEQATNIPDIPKAAIRGAQSLVAVLGPAIKQSKKVPAPELAIWARDIISQLKLREAILEVDEAPSLLTRRVDNLNEVINAIDRYAASASVNELGLTNFLYNSALLRSPEENDIENNGRVTLMTLHAAKGLEFPYVMMVGMEEDLLPHKNIIAGDGDLSEERRLCYVGMTRAQRRLWLTYARQRRQYGKFVDRNPSRFLQEIPDSAAVNKQSNDFLASQNENSDDLANDFFKKMRSQLGIDVTD